MNSFETHEIGRDIVARYREKTSRSEKHFREAQRWLPGGETRRASFFSPYPIFMESGQGCYVFDCDGNQYFDLQNNYTSMIHGHVHPQINQAAREQMEKGVCLGSAAEVQYRHAEHICRRIPSVDMVRYNNSGTEATMFAMRLARAFSGKERLLKMDGGYHGQHDYAQVNIFSDPEKKGLPTPWAEPWIPKNIIKDMEVAPFNDLDAAEKIIRKQKENLAAVIMEPMFSAGGLFAPEPGYLEGMRELTKRNDVLLIFDEVMMFRLHYGGLQSRFNVRPDITALGKIIGGGFPVGAVGGRKDIMELFSPAHPHSVFHSGTFNANNITLAAGLAALELYDEQAVERLNALGLRMMEGFKECLRKAGLKGQVTGLGSLLAVHWCESAPKNAQEFYIFRQRTLDLMTLFHLEMLNQGVFAAPRGMFSLTTPMTEADVDQIIDSFGTVLSVLKPYVADTLPHMLAN